MMDLGTTASATIDAPIDEVWNALTTPEVIKRWFFGVDTETDWQVGSPLVHRGEWQGKPYEDKGTILAFEPPTTLVHTHWSPASGEPGSSGALSRGHLVARGARRPHRSDGRRDQPPVPGGEGDLRAELEGGPEQPQGTARDVASCSMRRSSRS